MDRASQTGICNKMALKLTVELCNGGSYLCGEKLHCRVHFTNESTSDGQVVAWCGAQLHCQCTFREDLVNPPSPPSGGLPRTQTSFLPSSGEKGFTAVSTNPVVLCCDLKLKPGECHSFDFSETVPLYCVPSFTGRLVRYTWKLSVGASRGVNADAQIIRIPFQVMTVPESILTHLSPTESPHFLSNPFLQHAQQDHPQHRDVILQGLAHQTSGRAPSTYELKTDQGVIGRMQLFKSVYRLGEEIIGTLDLSKATIPCLQVRVLLEAIEEVCEGHFCGADKNLRSVTSAHAQDTQCCSFALQKHFTLPVPAHVTHTFTSEVVTYSWQLRFEFVTGQDRVSLGQMVASPSGSHQEWRGGKVVPYKTSLTLPVTILSTNPAQVESRFVTKQVIEI